jgi:hypothetical protein
LFVSDEERDRFVKNPQYYLKHENLIPPPPHLAIIGPSGSGKVRCSSFADCINAHWCWQSELAVHLSDERRIPLLSMDTLIKVSREQQTDLGHAHSRHSIVCCRRLTIQETDGVSQLQWTKGQSWTPTRLLQCCGKLSSSR